MDLNEVLPALRALQPGQSMVYYEGFLQDDRDPSSNHKHPDHVLINAIANEAYFGYYIGDLELTQRRLSPPMAKIKGGEEVNWHTGVGPGFAYIAHKRIKPGEDKRKKEAGYGRVVKEIRRGSGTVSEGDKVLHPDDKVLRQESGSGSGEHRVLAGVAD